MSRWTHAMCDGCWAHLAGGGEPTRVTPPSLETCCVCGRAAIGGIYFRADPAELKCAGRHEENGPVLLTPGCIGCGYPPYQILDGGRQAWCVTDGCRIIFWDMTRDVDGNLDGGVNSIDLSGWTSGE